MKLGENSKKIVWISFGVGNYSVCCLLFIVFLLYVCLLLLWVNCFN